MAEGKRIVEQGKPRTYCAPRSLHPGLAQNPTTFVLDTSSTASKIGAAEPRKGSSGGLVSSATCPKNPSASASPKPSLSRLTAATEAGLTRVETSS